MTRAEAMCNVPRAAAHIASEADTTNLIIITSIVGMIFALYLMRTVSKVKLEIGKSYEMAELVEKGTKGDQARRRLSTLSAVVAPAIRTLTTSCLCTSPLCSRRGPRLSVSTSCTMPSARVQTPSYRPSTRCARASWRSLRR